MWSLVTERFYVGAHNSEYETEIEPQSYSWKQPTEHLTLFNGEKQINS